MRGRLGRMTIWSGLGRIRLRLGAGRRRLGKSLGGSGASVLWPSRGAVVKLRRTGHDPKIRRGHREVVRRRVGR